MPSALPDIELAFQTRLMLLTSEPEVAWSDVPYVPKNRTPYLTAKMQGRNRTPMGIGPVTPHLWQGSYTIVAVHPADEGARRVLLRAAAVLDHFPRALTLTAGTAKVIIEAGSIEPSYATADALNVPVILRWYSEEV